MSKTPLKYNAGLVQGAYEAASAGQPGPGQQDAMGQGMDDLMNISKDAVGNIVEKRKQQKEIGDQLAEDCLDRAGALGTSWYDQIEKEVSGMHSQYSKNAAFGRNKKNKMIMQEQNELGASVNSMKDFTTSLAEDTKPTDGTAPNWSSSITEKEQGVINSFLANDSNKKVFMEDGKRVLKVETPQGWMSQAEAERMVNEHKKDYKTTTEIRKQAIDVVDKAKADALRMKEEGVEGSYDIVKATAKMDNTLKNGNLRSLMHDDVLENGTPWVKAVNENPEIKGMTYASLGLTPPPGDDGIIGNEDDPEGANMVLNSEHRDLVVDALINPDNNLYDEDRTRGLMACLLYTSPSPRDQRGSRLPASA